MPGGLQERSDNILEQCWTLHISNINSLCFMSNLSFKDALFRGDNLFRDTGLWGVWTVWCTAPSTYGEPANITEFYHRFDVPEPELVQINVIHFLLSDHWSIISLMIDWPEYLSCICFKSKSVVEYLECMTWFIDRYSTTKCTMNTLSRLFLTYRQSSSSLDASMVFAVFKETYFHFLHLPTSSCFPSCFLPVFLLSLVS